MKALPWVREYTGCSDAVVAGTQQTMGAARLAGQAMNGVASIEAAQAVGTLALSAGSIAANMALSQQEVLFSHSLDGLLHCTQQGVFSRVIEMETWPQMQLCNWTQTVMSAVKGYVVAYVPSVICHSNMGARNWYITREQWMMDKCKALDGFRVKV
jgi:hypothetical protein